MIDGIPNRPLYFYQKDIIGIDKLNTAQVNWQFSGQNSGDLSKHVSFFSFCWSHPHLGVSENSVPLNPMVNDHYPY